MIIIKIKKKIKLIPDYDLNNFLKKPGFKILKRLNGEYPSMKTLSVSKKGNIDDFVEYLNSEIGKHNKVISQCKKQLLDFKKETLGLI